jgi:hypothetical protein
MNELQPRGYLFLDIDGVLNPLAGRMGDDWRIVRAGMLNVWFSDDLSTWLHSLIDQGIQIVWATTWIEIPIDLAELAVHYGLPTDLPRIERMHWEGQYECGKRAGVNSWLLKHGIDPLEVPVAWVDDKLGERDLAWAKNEYVHAIKVPELLGLANPIQRERIENAFNLITTTQGA